MYNGSGKQNLLMSRIIKPNRKLQIAGFVPTKYDARNFQDTRTLAAITEQLAGTGTIFAPIPRSTDER